MTDDPFDRLLGAMPKIAEAVNAFASPDVQRRAFDALLATLGAIVEARTSPLTPETHRSDDGSSLGTGLNEAPKVVPMVPTTKGSKPQRRRSRTLPKQWTPNRSLNVRPDGKKSLQDFVNEKQPNNAFEKNLVAVYWLKSELGKNPVDIADVMACYRACGWPIPDNLPNRLSVTGTRKGWLDTRDRTNLSVTVVGENAVLHELPAPKKSKKAN